MRKFEKISFSQFQKDVSNDRMLYDSYHLPQRKTKGSAGYDFEALYDFVLEPGEEKIFPTGVKVQMNEDEALLFVVRSSMGFKYNIRLKNQVGITDSDYYNNISNEGHMFIALQNEGKKAYTIKKGDAICQGVFIHYLKVDDDTSDGERISGIGSTNKGGNL